MKRSHCIDDKYELLVSMYAQSTTQYDAGNYISIPIYPIMGRDKIEAKFKARTPQTGLGKCIAGNYQKISGTAYRFGILDSGASFCFMVSAGGSWYGSRNTTPFNYNEHTAISDTKNNIYKIDNTSISMSKISTTFNSYLLINGYGGSVETNKFSNDGYIYYVKYYRDDVLIYDLVPAKRLSDNVVGVINLLDNTFYEPSVGSFTGVSF